MAEPGVHAKFFKHPVLHANKSKEAGRQIFVEKDYIHITVAGMDKQDTIRPVIDPDKARFPEEWRRYEAGGEQKREGTPIRQWPQITPHQANALEQCNVWTVEDMATLSDAGLAEVGMGARQLQADARKYLSGAQTAVDHSKYEELIAANETKDAQIAALQKQLADLASQVAKLAVRAEVEPAEEPAPKRRGKPAEPQAAA